MSKRVSPMALIKGFELISFYKLGNWCSKHLAGMKEWLGHLFEIQEQLIAEHLGLDVESKK
jgi:hypothetical protein